MADVQPTHSLATPRRLPSLWAVLLAFVLVAMLGAGAIALEKPTGQAAGQVLSEVTGRPLAGASVTVSGPVTRRLLTQPDGHFRFYNLPVGTYYLSAKQRRFDSQFQEHSIEVAEGKSVEDLDFKLVRTIPTLDITNQQRVFTPNENVRILTRGTAAPTIEVSLYSLDLSKAMAIDPELKLLHHPDVSRLRAEGLVHSVKHWSQAVPKEAVDDDDWFFKPVQVGGVSEGAYVVELGTQPEIGPDDKKAPPAMRAAYWFEVSRLALVAKRSENQLIVYGADMVKKGPVKNVHLEVFADKRRVGNGVTGADGIARMPAPNGKEHIWVLGTDGASPAIVAAGWSQDASDYQIYGYSDRPVYRPGQQVHFKAIARALKGATYSLAQGKAAVVTIKDDKGGETDKQTLALSGASTLSGNFTLPADAALGEYTVTIDLGNSSHDFRFKVADYRKPEYKVDITPDKPLYVQGSLAKVHILSTYYFGAPVPGAKLAVAVYSAPLYGAHDPSEDFFSGFLGDNAPDPIFGFGDVVQQIEGATDAQGKFDLDVKLPEGPHAGETGWVGDRVFTVTVEAIDASGRPVKGHQSFTVTQGQIKLDVQPDDYLYVGKHPIRLSIKSEDYIGHPASADVTLELTRLVNEQKVDKEGNEISETKRVPAWAGKGHTDARGMATVEVPIQPPGDYEVLAQTHDAGGNLIQAIGSAWVAAEDTPFMGEGNSRSGSLKLVLDRKVYKPGDVARALIVSPVANVSALVTVEGFRLHEARVVQLHGTTALVSFTVTKDYEPNAYIAACVVNGKEFLEASRSLNVTPAEKFLKVSVKSDKPRYEPGDRATYTVETKDYNGRPVAADVSLGVVDQAIYAIEPDNTPDIRYFFHGPRWNLVRTSYSFAEDYSGGLDKFAPDPRVRAKFEDTAAWFPAMHTDASGKASVTITLPDNLTTWVATARAATTNTLVGAASSTAVATKNLLVRLETPRFVVEGDHVTISAIAHSYLDEPQEVQLTLSLEGLTMVAPPTQRTILAPGDAKRVAWDVTVPATGTVKARITARSAKASDAMELTLPAESFAIPQFEGFSGVADSTKPGYASFHLPQDFVPGSVKLGFKLHPTPVADILAGIDYLHKYPYGCVEQTMSRFLPDVAVKPRLDAVSVPTNGIFDDHRARTKEGMQRLLGMQHGDGGWGWWEHDETQVDMTAYVLYGLAEARGAGLKPPDGAVKKGLDNLGRALPRLGKDVFTRESVRRGAGADARAFALFALAKWDRAPKAEVTRLWNDRDDLSVFGRAQFELVLARSKDDRRFELLDALRHQADESEGLAHWNANAEEFAWQDNSTEATAYALEALLAVAPDDTLVDRTVRWLESKNARGYWESTKDTGAAAIALAEYMKVRHPGEPQDMHVVVTLNGTPVQPTRGATGAADPTLDMPKNAILAGENKLEVTVSGQGTLDFSGGVAFAQVATNTVASPGQGLLVARDYYALPASVYAKAKGKGSWGEFYDEKVVAGLAKLNGQTKLGDRVLVRVILTTDRPTRYMALEDPLPAGCEVLEDTPTQWSYWWDHQEYRDDRVAFFFKHLEKGTQSLYYVMRPTTPGRYRVLPSSVWAMYAPDVRAHGAGGELTITE